VSKGYARGRVRVITPSAEVRRRAGAGASAH
jgi:hypothetical protein